MNNYKAKLGTAFKDKDAKVIGKFIDSKFPDGATPQQLIESARSKASPIHKYFEWDNTRAAELYRLQQARRMVQCLVVIVNEEPIRAYHHVYIEEDKEKRYLPLKTVKQAPELWQQVLEEALKEAVSWKTRYEQYESLSPIVTAINIVERSKPWQKRKQSKRKKSKALKSLKSSTGKSKSHSQAQARS